MTGTGPAAGSGAAAWTGGGCESPDVGGLGPGSVGVTEENLRKNCLFLSVTLPLPSILILNLLCPRSSMTVPDLSHLFDILPAPCWFWTRTLWPRLRGARFLVCSLHLSNPLENLVFIASSLFSRQSIQTSEGEKCPGLIGRKSLMGRPKTNWAGERPYSESGVFLCCMIALIILS